MTEVSVRAAGPSSLVTYRVGGREYPMKTVRNCRVCMSPYRFDIEEALISGRTYSKIVESLPEDSDLNVRNVKDHYLNEHLPLEQAGIRRIVESRAERVGKSIEDSVESLIDGITLAEVVVQKTFEAIANSEVVPDIKDGMAAAKFLADMGEYDEAGGTDMLAVTEAFMVYHESAEQLMSPEQFEAFGKALSANPVLKALAAKYDGDIVEGEIVPEEQEESLAGGLDNG